MSTAPEADFGGEAIVVIKIARSLDEGRSVYDASRAAWVLDPKRAAKADYVVVASRGEILDVFSPDRWVHAFDEEIAHLSDPANDHNRYGYVGRAAPEELRERWSRRRLPAALTRRGAANPVRYWNI